jgi:hypothetical protein
MAASSTTGPGGAGPLRPIRLDGVSLGDVENMAVSALRDALSSVIRQEASTAEHQNHQSHSNTSDGVETPLSEREH